MTIVILTKHVVVYPLYFLYSYYQSLALVVASVNTFTSLALIVYNFPLYN